MQSASATILGDNKLSWERVFRPSILIFKGSFIGVVLGAIPGIGPFCRCIFFYSEQKEVRQEVRILVMVSLKGIACNQESEIKVAVGGNYDSHCCLRYSGDVIKA